MWVGLQGAFLLGDCTGLRDHSTGAGVPTGDNQRQRVEIGGFVQVGSRWIGAHIKDDVLRVSELRTDRPGPAERGRSGAAGALQDHAGIADEADVGAADERRRGRVF